MAPQTAPARQNLPPESTSLIGRERELSDLLRLLDADRVVALCGVSGIGKTRLALRLAGQATASFRDGVWLVELADTSNQAEVIAGIAGALGAFEEAAREPRATLQDTLRNRQLLLVLDGCDRVTEAVASLAQMLVDTCPSVSLLLTSAEPVGVAGETVRHVPPLSVPPADAADPLDSEAVRLFLERAGASSPGADPMPEEVRTVADICRDIDGIPLCVELAAAWARRFPVHRVADSLATRLPAHNGRASPARTEILHAVIDWSHALLSDSERVLLRRLSAFRDWNLELAERVCRGDPLHETAILDAMSGLVDRCLVALAGEYHGRMRYRLPLAVRRHAHARLVEAGEDERFRDRHREAMTRIAQDLGRMAVLGQAMPWSERFGYWQTAVDEYANLRSALHWSAAREDAEAGLRLCVGLRPFWATGYNFAEGITWNDRFLDMPGAREALRGQAMVRRAELAWARHDHRRAMEIGEEGLRRCRDASDDDSVLLGLNLLAMVDVREHAYERGRKRLAESLKLARDTGDLWNEALALAVTGAIIARQDDLAEADIHYGTALMILRGMDHRWGVGITLMAQGALAEAQRDLEGADRYYRESLDIQRDIGAAPELARCLAGVGRIAHTLGSAAQAYDYLSESLALSHATGQRSGVAEALISMARVAAGEGLMADAFHLAGAAEGIRESTGLPTSRYARWARETRSAGSGTDTHSARWSQGRALDLDDAVAVALDVAESARSPRGRAPAVPPGTAPETALTRREREIARLVGAGHSNRTIAEELFISQATVARHIANINRKMGFNSRTQIAAWISQHYPAS